MQVPSVTSLCCDSQSEVSGLQPKRVPHCATFCLLGAVTYPPRTREAVGWLGVSWQWCHRLCQCESCPELG